MEEHQELGTQLTRRYIGPIGCAVNFANVSQFSLSFQLANDDCGDIMRHASQNWVSVANGVTAMIYPPLRASNNTAHLHA
jgi:hypothetical protein